MFDIASMVQSAEILAAGLVIAWVALAILLARTALK